MSAVLANREINPWTALAINVFLRTSHDVMPNYQLSREEVEDIVAFIMSLKDRKVR
jgi:mono/diheme cytochrome c family protein